LFILLIPKDREDAIKGVGLLTAAVAFLFSLGVAAGFDYSAGGYNTYQFEVDLPWIGAINSNFHLGVDGISLPLLVLSTFLVLLCVIYSWNHWDEPRIPKSFLILMLILATGMNGSIVALVIQLFLILFEVVILPMYYIIAVWGVRTMRPF